MATAPFNIDQTAPQDNDIVSQFPANERTNRDVIESWLLVNHDTNGQHPRVDIPRSASVTSPTVNIDTIYSSTTGKLKEKHSDGTEEFVGIPPGMVLFYSSTVLPTGYLEADGSAVSRTTFADLFAVFSTFYGAGDGSTTFNLPDLRGRVISGIDNGAGRLTGAVLGAGLGAETTTLLTANLPPYTPAGTIVTTVTITGSYLNNGVTSGTASMLNGVGGPTAAASATSTFTGTPQGGTSTPISRVQPTMTLRAVIKY